MFTIRGCSPTRGEICSCTHVPEIQCIHIKTVLSLLKGTHQAAEPFSTSFFSFYIFWFILYTGIQFMYVFLIVYLSSSTQSSRLTSQISFTFESLIVITFPASSSSFVLLTCLQRHYHCNLQTDWNLAISLKHGQSWLGDKRDTVNLVQC